MTALGASHARLIAIHRPPSRTAQLCGACTRARDVASSPALGDVHRQLPRQGNSDAQIDSAHVTGEFFLLAFGAALNPKLLAIDLLLARNRRARAMFLCVLIGAATVALTIGLIDVLVVRADAVQAQGHVSAGVDLALGAILLAVGALIFTRRLPVRRARPPSAGKRTDLMKAKEQGWAQRVLREPRLGIAMVIGAIIGLPGALYLSALHNLIAGKSSTATQIVGVIVFVVIELSLIIIPFLFLELRPASTTATLERSQRWLLANAKQVIAWIAVLLGSYLFISALVRLA